MDQKNFILKDYLIMNAASASHISIKGFKSWPHRNATSATRIRRQHQQWVSEGRIISKPHHQQAASTRSISKPHRKVVSEGCISTIKVSSKKAARRDMAHVMLNERYI
ncbi:hypothetical protein Tco_0761415 [Tanacetum coccineum]